MPARSRVSGALLLAAALVACGGSPPPPPKPPPKPSAAESGEAEKGVRMARGVTLVAEACEPSGEDEPCDAIDDDCDGAIDEGCGYQTGGVQITISWNTGADIDLYVRDPSGESVFYNEQRRHSPVGGVLDYDARGQCRAEQELNHVENAFWPAPAPKGHYVVELHYFGPCGDSVPTTVTLGVAFDGRTMGHYRYDLSPEERISALEFDVK